MWLMFGLHASFRRMFSLLFNINISMKMQELDFLVLDTMAWTKD